MLERGKNTVSAINSPHELALGITFGVMIGLMPKDSIIPWILGLLFLLSRANLLCGIMAGIAMSIVSPLLDPVSDRMGLSLLSLEALQSSYAHWMEFPWVAWTRFNNTVVAGSLAIGVLAALPVYLVSQVFFRAWGIVLIQKIMGLPVIRLLLEPSSEDSEDSSDESTLVIES